MLNTAMILNFLQLAQHRVDTKQTKQVGTYLCYLIFIMTLLVLVHVLIKYFNHIYTYKNINTLYNHL